MCWRTCGEHVSFTDVKIKIPGPEDVNYVMHRKRARRILGDLKKRSVELSWELDTGREGSTFGARRGQTNLGATGAARDGVGGGEDGKARIERMCISLPYVETFNSKLIKGFVPELRRRYVFFVFRDSYVLCIYVMNILCTFRISVSDYGTQWLSWYIRSDKFIGSGFKGT